MHLLFFDETCPLCQKAVRMLLQIDRNEIFLFAPLSGKTAEQQLTGRYAELRKKNTLILFENYQTEKQRVWVYGRGAMRLFWLLGGKWKFLGVLCYLPIGPDLFYRIIAHHRHHLSSAKITPFEGLRFLP